MDRRKFVTGVGAGALSMRRLLATTTQSARKGVAAPGKGRQPVLVRAGLTRRPDGTNAPPSFPQETVVRSFDSEGRLAVFVVPIGKHKAYQGAPLHLHHEQDEWIYILQGEFVAEVGGHRMRLKQGDSLLMPMRVPHRWSAADSPVCGAMHLYTPAGLMDISWDPKSKDDTPLTPEQMKADFERYGMTLLGAPLTKDEIVGTT